MNKIIFLIIFLILSFNSNAKENMMILKLKDGDVKIELFEELKDAFLCLLLRS